MAEEIRFRSFSDQVFCCTLKDVCLQRQSVRQCIYRMFINTQEVVRSGREGFSVEGGVSNGRVSKLLEKTGSQNETLTNSAFVSSNK